MTRAKLVVYVDLDPVPGNMHSAESAQNNVRNALLQVMRDYNPIVSLERADISVPLHPNTKADVVKELFPGASFGVDNDNQVIIYTDEKM